MKLANEGAYAGVWAYTESPVLDGTSVAMIVSGPTGWVTEVCYKEDLEERKATILHLEKK